MSGGVYIKQKKPFQPIENDLTVHPKDSDQEVLSLVRDSSIKGLFSYLMGETAKLKNIEDSSDSLVKKLNLSLNKMVEASAIKKTLEPHVTTFFERRKEKDFVSPSSLHLNQYTFETADPTIKLLEKPLNNLLEKKPRSLGEIHSFFKKDEISEKKEAERYEELKNKSIQINDRLENIPDSKIKNGIKTALQRVKDGMAISTQVIALAEEIINLCSQDKTFYKKIKDSTHGKFSCFTGLAQTKHWVDKQHYSIVRGAPGFIACADFDIYLSEEVFTENTKSNHLKWEEVVNKIKEGPNISRWGEGGIVLVEYYLNDMGCPYENKDNIFLEIKSLRYAGIKLKKYKWEIEEAEKEKAEKDKPKKKKESIDKQISKQ